MMARQTGWGHGLEQYDDNSAQNGTILVTSNSLKMNNSDGGTLESISRPADLAGAVSATLSFDYYGYGAGGLDIVAFEVSNDGGASYTVLEQMEVVGSVNGSRNFNLADYTGLTDQMLVRFRIAQGPWGYPASIFILTMYRSNRLPMTETATTPSATAPMWPASSAAMATWRLAPTRVSPRGRPSTPSGCWMQKARA